MTHRHGESCGTSSADSTGSGLTVWRKKRGKLARSRTQKQGRPRSGRPLIMEVVAVGYVGAMVVGLFVGAMVAVICMITGDDDHDGG